MCRRFTYDSIVTDYLTLSTQALTALSTSISPSFPFDLFSSVSFPISSSIWGIVSESLEGGKLDRGLEEAGYEVSLEGIFIGISGVINLSMTDQ